MNPMLGRRTAVTLPVKIRCFNRRYDADNGGSNGPYVTHEVKTAITGTEG